MAGPLDKPDTTRLPLRTADGSLTLHSTRYNQSYHSIHGAITESQHVFLDGAGVTEHLTTGKPLQILEIGLGLGMNALLTAQAAQQFGTNVDYLGIEFDFQTSELIKQVLAPFDTNEVERFCSIVDQCQQLPECGTNGDPDPIPARKPARSPTTYNAPVFGPLNEHFTLHVLPTDLIAALSPQAAPQLANTMRFDAIYLDAFSPDANPECWTPKILHELSKTLIPGGIIATYCAKGSVRRALEAAGLTVTRRPGPPGKRECLAAVARPQ